MTSEQPNNPWHIPLSNDGHVPMWFQIAERLRAAIESGGFEPGDVLPSEAELNAAFGVSRATSRAALNELQNEGLIVRRAGKGSIVLSRRIDQPAEQMSGFSEDMRRRGLTPSHETLESGCFPANREAAEALEVKRETPVFRSRRLLLADGEPMGVAISWIAPRLLRKVAPPSAAVLSEGSLYDWMKEHCGISIKRAHEYIEAAAANADMARALKIQKGAPILIARRTSFDAAGKPAEYVVLNFRADRYRFELEVAR